MADTSSENLKSNIDEVLQYLPDEGAIMSRNGLNQSNRPLYMSNGIFETVLTGDAPGACFSSGPVFSISIAAPKNIKNISDFDRYEGRHKPNRTSYVFSDKSFPGATFFLDVYPLHEGYGMVTSLCLPVVM